MTFTKVKETILESLKCDEAKIVPEAKLVEDLEMDSLDAADLSMAIEEAFDITISDDEFVNLKTVKDIVDYLDANK